MPPTIVARASDSSWLTDFGISSGAGNETSSASKNGFDILARNDAVDGKWPGYK